MFDIEKIQKYKADPELIPDEDIKLSVTHMLYYVLIEWNIKGFGFGQLTIESDEKWKTIFFAEGLSDKMISRILAKWVTDSIRD